ncbi:hypothetical protein [Pseudomonas sp. TE24901]
MHVISFSAVEENLFLLQQIAHGSYSTAKSLHDNFSVISPSLVEQTGLEMEMLSHQDFVKYFVGDYLIQCATKTRIIQDTYNFTIDNGDEGVYCPDAEAYDRYPSVAHSPTEGVKLSMREICNKIIHAKRLEFEFVESQDYGFLYWSGMCRLFGELRGKPWQLNLDVKVWVLAMRHYYEVIRHL